MARRSPTIHAAAAFDLLAEGWDAAHGPDSPRAREFADQLAWLRGFCRRVRPARVLEIGCGTGHNLIGIADLVTFALGADVSPAMTARAGRNAASLDADRLGFITGDALTLSPEALGAFDAVLFVGALEHIAPQPEALRVARALLAPEGRVAVIMPHPWQPGLVLRGPPRVDGRPIATRLLAPRRLARLARTAGLEIVALAGLSPYRLRRPQPWRPLPLGRLGSASAALGRAYAAELRVAGAG